MYTVEVDFQHVSPDFSPRPGLPPHRTFVNYRNGDRMAYKVDLDHVHDYGKPQAPGGDQQADRNRQVALQYAYLTGSTQSIQGLDKLNAEPELASEFSARLDNIARDAISDYLKSKNIPISRGKPAKLKAIGSLACPFALPDSVLDMTLLPSQHYPRRHESAYPRVLEKKFLDIGFGARFLPNERVPTLLVCEKPSPRLLNSLRAERHRRYCGQSRDPIAGDTCVVPFPDSGVGMRCDITFSQPLAVQFRNMLKCYDLCDHRVRKLVLFVKQWARNRGINDPSDGTLSSTGYVLMVLHYLMNVANPPVIPNLQYDAPFTTTIIQGCKVGFHNNMEEIKYRLQAGKMSKNTECLASLIQGFFRYYASRGRSSPEGGFNWIRDTISIRTPRGGLLPKAEKGWTTGRMEKGFWNSYLLAIEDPFDIALNHGQTVNRDGVRRIRDEIMRADTIIHRVQYIPGAGMMWRNNKGLVGEHLLASSEEKSYQEGITSKKYPKAPVTSNTPEEKARTSGTKTPDKPAPEPQKQGATHPPKRGMFALLDSMARLKAQREGTPAQRQKQLLEQNRDQFAKGAQEMKRILSSNVEASQWETPGNSSTKKIGVNGANGTAVEQKQASPSSSSESQKPYVTNTVLDGGYGEKVNSDSVPSLTTSSGRRSSDSDIPDWDSLASLCSSMSDSNAEFMAELPFEGINISFKKK